MAKEGSELGKSLDIIEPSEVAEMFVAHVKPLVDNIREWIDSMTEEEKN